MSNTATKRIVILGGGFAGVYGAMKLERMLAQDPEVEITLVNRENFFLFTPMLHEVAASDLDLTAIVNPIRKMLKRASFFEGEVEAIDLSRKQVIVSHGFDHHQHSLTYDQLVIGVGSVTNLYEMPGLDERTLTMKSLGDAIRLRNHLIEILEEADSECLTQKNPLLTFVVAGGGFAGVETVGALNDLVRDALPSYSHLSEGMLRVVLVHAGPVLLPEPGEKLGLYAQRKLAERGVEIRVNTKVKALSGRGVELSDGTIIESQTVVWTAGTSPNPHTILLPKSGGRQRSLSCFRQSASLRRLGSEPALQSDSERGPSVAAAGRLAGDRKTTRRLLPSRHHARSQLGRHSRHLWPWTCTARCSQDC